MSSIAFIHSPSRGPEERKVAIKGMNHFARHRGPDASAIYNDEYVSMGHNRLRISDQQANTDQPYVHKHYVLILDGRIYNAAEIRRVLTAEGLRFETEADVEVLLKAYIYWGKDYLQELNGNWAFVLYDKKEQEIIAARDRFGIKPFYFIKSDEILAIASEIKQLLPFTEAEVEDETSYAYFNKGYVDYSRKTLYKYIHMLRPSECLSYNLNSGAIELETYYQLPNAKSIADKYELEELLYSSVSLRKRENFSTAITLSGGLDSSILTYLSSKNDKKNISAFTSGFPWWDGDEGKAATQSADFFGLKFFLDNETFWNILKAEIGKLSYIHDVPLPSYASYASFQLYKLIAKYRIKVALNGQGLDELFAGYDSYFVRYINHLRKRKPARALSEMVYGMKLKQFNYMSLLDRGINHFSTSKKWLKRDFEMKMNYPEHSQLPFLGQLAFKAIHNHSMASIIHSVDRNSMYHGVESRMPFLDYRVVEYALYLEDKKKIYRGKRKYILREKFNDKLPEHISQRHKKQGYGTPQDILLEKDKEGVLSRVRDLKEHLPDWIDRDILLNGKELNEDLKLLWRVWAWVSWREYVVSL